MCFEIEELLGDLLSSFTREELLRFQNWKIDLFETTALRNGCEMRKEPIALSHFFWTEIPCP